MKVNKKMDMSLVLKPERWAPVKRSLFGEEPGIGKGEVFQKQNFLIVGEGASLLILFPKKVKNGGGCSCSCTPPRPTTVLFGQFWGV